APVSRINQTFRATTIADSPGERPPSDAEGLDRPSENEAQLDDLHDEFDQPSRVEAADAAGPDSDDESLFPKLTKLSSQTLIRPLFKLHLILTRSIKPS
ncbi:Transcription factor iws1, partial [Exophiala xenobiotica]